MAYVPSFEHDVFISYAHADNVGGRVREFRDDLVRQLTIALGSRAFHRPKEWVFLDETGLQAGDRVDPRLERAAQRSAVMVALLSPSYLQSPWCISECERHAEAGRLARDPVERRLIPVEFNPADADEIAKFPRFAERLRAGALGEVGAQIAAHLTKARKLHGAVFLGQAYSSAQAARNTIGDELRGFRCVPGTDVFAEETAVAQALAEAKVAVHFLGDANNEAPHSASAIALSLEHCKGRTVLYLPPGQKLDRGEQQFVEQIGSRGTRFDGTPSELVKFLTDELEAFRFPDAAKPLALACDASDLDTVRRFGREIHEKTGGEFRVETPEFLADPNAMAYPNWRKLRTKKCIVAYWGAGRKDELDTYLGDLKAATLGRAWYVSGTEPEAKTTWVPADPETRKIHDEREPWSFDKIAPFLDEVRKKAKR